MVYQPATFTRTAIESTQDLGKSNLRITTSRRLDFLNQFIASSPTDVITLILRRLHASDANIAVTWRGRVTNVRFNENTAEIRLEPITSSLRRPGLRRAYQINCPHVLYGDSCRAVRNNFSTSATLTSVNGNLIEAAEFEVSINPTFNADWFIGGYVEFNNNGLFDRRFITGQSSQQLILNLPFPDLAVGDSVVAYAGCAHTTQHCNDKFNNILNHGGFPFIPSKNPMNGTPVF